MPTRQTAPADTGTPAYELPPQEKIGPIQEALAEEYGDLKWPAPQDPLDELVCTILSQHTSDLNRDRAFASLRSTFPTWDQVANAPTPALAESIKSGGLGNIKAPRIQQVLRQILEERGSWDLTFLYTMPTDEARAWLSKFNGVGPKTAACVLMFACGHPVLPVDTHVYRVSQRLGLIDAKTSAEKAHDVLEAMLPPEKRYTFHVNMITHGRRVCKAQHPMHEACVVREWCSYYNDPAGLNRQGAKNAKEDAKVRKVE